MTPQDRLLALKKVAADEKISEAEVFTDWEDVLREMGRCGFDVAQVFYDLQTLKADHDRNSRQRLHNPER